MYVHLKTDVYIQKALVSALNKIESTLIISEIGLCAHFKHIHFMRTTKLSIYSRSYTNLQI